MVQRDPLGAYGLRLEGLDGAAELLSRADPSWPTVTVESRIGPVDDAADMLSERSASLRLRTGGRVLIDRGKSHATISTPRRLEAFEIVHPYLAPIAGVMSYWLGRESFHGGAVQVGDVAWGVLGDRDSGKSTLLAWLALHGIGVVADDQLVVERDVCFVGPRTIDLRRSAAERLGGAAELGVVGARERWRVVLGELPAQLPLAGWCCLEWAESVEVTRVSGAKRLELLGLHRGVLVPPRDPALLLELAALPLFVLRRPRRWESLGECGDALLELARG